MTKKKLVRIALASGAVAGGLSGLMMNGLVGLLWGALLGGVLAAAITSSFNY